ncbi:MAG: GNAT family N-acetyltransferase [Syntrophaceae bacterium]|nr:GNAT family N-acetyltransferase [Syntrophaceae bacterium]
MAVEIVEGNPPPENLLPIWESLLHQSRSPNPFLTPLWNQLWLEHFGSVLELKTLLLRSAGGEPLGLGLFSHSRQGRWEKSTSSPSPWPSLLEGEGTLPGISNPSSPLGEARTRREFSNLLPGEMEGKSITLLGSKDVWDYRDLILSAGKEKEALALLARWAADGPWAGLDFSGISEFSPTLEFLPSLLQASGFRVQWEVEEVAVFLKIPATWDDFLAQLGSKDRHELRRKMRRLEREAAFEIKEGAGETLDQRLDSFFELHRKSRRDKAEFMIPRMETFFREIAHRFQERGWFSLPFLRVEGRDIAAYFSFRYGGIEYVYNSGYDPDYSRLSPGIVLAAHCIGQAIEKRLKVFHFLRGQEDYKYRLGGKEEKIYRIEAMKE